MYLLVNLDPTGLNWVEAQLRGEHPQSLYAIGRDECNALLSKLIDGDYSTEFFEALKLGNALRDLGRRFHFNLEKTLGGKRKTAKRGTKGPRKMAS